MAHLPSTVTSVAHIERLHTNYPGSNYILPSDDDERDRLTRQHQQWQRTFDDKYLVAPVSISKTDHVLETGTGPGDWLLELATQLPGTVGFQGVDIEPRFFPKIHPENVKFSRLLMLALSNVEWPIALKELYRVLCPGGWLQLGEAMAALSPGPCGEKHKALLYAITRQRGINIDVALDLTSMLTEAGFASVHAEERKFPVGAWGGKEGMEHKVNAISFLKGLKTPTLKAGGLGVIQSEPEFDALVAGMHKEFDEQRAFTRVFIICAQKPTF